MFGPPVNCRNISIALTDPDGPWPILSERYGLFATGDVLLLIYLLRRRGLQQK